MTPFDDPKLVAKYGSWMRVQVEFYDFCFETATNLCAAHWNRQSICEALAGQGFSNGGNLYEDTVKAIEGEWSSFGKAWAAFLADQENEQ